jgi:hypothetical protein
MAILKQPARVIKKAALGNVPKGADADTQKFLEDVKSELFRVSSMAVQALELIKVLQAAASAASSSSTESWSGVAETNGALNLPALGLQVRWGRFTAAKGGSVPVRFREPFTSECFVVVAGGTNTTAGDAQENAVDVDTTNAPTKEGFSATSARDGSTTGMYIAIGK